MFNGINVILHMFQNMTQEFSFCVVAPRTVGTLESAFLSLMEPQRVHSESLGFEELFGALAALEVPRVFRQVFQFVCLKHLH